MNNIISCRLKKLRDECGLNQRQLAEKVGLSTSTYSRFETGEREPLTTHIVLFSKFYNVSTDYILGLSNDRSYKVENKLQNEKTDISLSDHERDLILAYRKYSEFQAAIDSMLHIEPDTTEKQAKKIG